MRVKGNKYQNLQKKLKGRNTPSSFYKARITLIPQPNKDTSNFAIKKILANIPDDHSFLYSSNVHCTSRLAKASFGVSNVFHKAFTPQMLTV